MNGASTHAEAEARALWPIRRAELSDIPQLVRMFAGAVRALLRVMGFVEGVSSSVLAGTTRS